MTSIYPRREVRLHGGPANDEIHTIPESQGVINVAGKDDDGISGLHAYMADRDGLFLYAGFEPWEL